MKWLAYESLCRGDIIAIHGPVFRIGDELAVYVRCVRECDVRRNDVNPIGITARDIEEGGAVRPEDVIAAARDA
jgi:hypothetical protein